MQNELLNNQNKPFLEWYYDEANDWIYANWIGYISRENVIKGVTALLETLNVTQCPYLLNDNRTLCGPWDQANDWMEDCGLSKLSESGLKYMAHVLSPGIAGALSAQDLHRRVDNHFNMQLFGDMEKARNWLKEMQQQSLAV